MPYQSKAYLEMPSEEGGQCETDALRLVPLLGEGVGGGSGGSVATGVHLLPQERLAGLTE